MKTAVASVPAIEAVTPARIESWPRPGPTVRSSTMVSFAGKAPARSSTARSLACWTVKRPEIWPDPPVIGCRTRGAEMTSLSSTMARARPTFSVVVCPKRWAPRRLKRKLTIGSLVR